MIATQPVESEQNFGFTVGGPVWIPKGGDWEYIGWWTGRHDGDPGIIPFTEVCCENVS